MYLFIFAVLIIIFQFVNSKNILDDYENKLDKFEKREMVYQDSIRKAQDENFDLMHFQLEFNEEAMSSFESKGYNIAELIPFIKDQLLNLNVYEGDDHPIVPYASMTGNKMLINEIRLLNNKWIIANFSDGRNWGEMLIEYRIENSDDKDELKFNLLDYVYYPSNR